MYAMAPVLEGRVDVPVLVGEALVLEQRAVVVQGHESAARVVRGHQQVRAAVREREPRHLAPTLHGPALVAALDLVPQ